MDGVLVSGTWMWVEQIEEVLPEEKEGPSKGEVTKLLTTTPLFCFISPSHCHPHLIFSHHLYLHHYTSIITPNVFPGMAEGQRDDAGDSRVHHRTCRHLL